VPRPENAEIYRKYKALADATPNVHFVGRLATYKYYNMDQVVAQALTLYRKIADVTRDEAFDLDQGKPNVQQAKAGDLNAVLSLPGERASGSTQRANGNGTSTNGAR
jgi:hypothetical protein